MATSATSTKELNVVKHSCNPLNDSHNACSKKNMRPVLDWMIKMVPSIEEGQRICNKCRTTLINLLTNFGNEAAVSSSS
jgi:hypothetical protein